jgi:DNA invertase Pin-like site-specific DNA recombinase
VKAGLANAKRRGTKVGRPRAIVNVGKVREMAANGLSARAIAKAIGVSDYTVRRVLSCEKTLSADAPSDRNDSALPAVESRRE